MTRQEKARVRAAAWYKANPERAVASRIAWKKANLEKYRSLTAAWREANKEKLRAYNAAYQEANKDKIRVTKAVWRKNNAEKKRARDIAYGKANPEKKRAARTKWSKAHPEYGAANCANRRAKLREAEGQHTAEEIKKLLARQKMKCAACKKSIEAGYDRDHIVPLCKGGSNYIRNIQLLCPTCNGKKHAKHPIKFMQEMGYLL